MADGKWVMTEDDAKRVDLTHSGSGLQNMRDLPNYGQHKSVDDRDGKATGDRSDNAADGNSDEPSLKCAFCGSDDLQTGFGGFGEGFGYKSFKCRSCGGTTDFVYKDEIGKYFK